jgi:carbon storage regulator
MLILTRRIGEKILVGQDIVIQVTEIGETRCRIGIVAPAAIKILREELSRDERKEVPQKEQC